MIQREADDVVVAGKLRFSTKDLMEEQDRAILHMESSANITMASFCQLYWKKMLTTNSNSTLTIEHAGSLIVVQETYTINGNITVPFARVMITHNSFS